MLKKRFGVSFKEAVLNEIGTIGSLILLPIFALIFTFFFFAILINISTGVVISIIVAVIYETVMYINAVKWYRLTKPAHPFQV